MTEPPMLCQACHLPMADHECSTASDYSHRLEERLKIAQAALEQIANSGLSRRAIRNLALEALEKTK